MRKQVIILGTGGHARVIRDIVAACGDEVIGFLDDRSEGIPADCHCLGTIAQLPEFADEAAFIVGIGNWQVRKRLMQQYQVNWYTAIHPAAVIGSGVSIGAGSAVMAGAVVNCASTIGRGVIINTGATVDHDCNICDFAHLSPGSHLAGTVSVGEGTWICTGACVVNNLTICASVLVGAGAAVIRSIDQPGTYVGVPARRIR